MKFMRVIKGRRKMKLRRSSDGAVCYIVSEIGHYDLLYIYYLLITVNFVYNVLMYTRVLAVHFVSPGHTCGKENIST